VLVLQTSDESSILSGSTKFVGVVKKEVMVALAERLRRRSVEPHRWVRLPYVTPKFSALASGAIGSALRFERRGSRFETWEASQVTRGYSPTGKGAGRF
jgi:hypothetical protein